MSRRAGNFFAVLAEDAPSAPSFSLAPSLLAGQGGADGCAASAGYSGIGEGSGAPFGGRSATAVSSSAMAAPAAAAFFRESPGAGASALPHAWSMLSALPSAAVSSSSSSGAPAGTAAARAGSAALDLASITNELLADCRALPAPAAQSAWDFSGLAVTAEEETRRTCAEAEARQCAMEARIAAAASDRDMLRERMQTQRPDLPRGARRRMLDAADRGTDHGGRLEAKVYKRDQASRARNKAKGMW